MTNPNKKGITTVTIEQTDEKHLDEEVGMWRGEPIVLVYDGPQPPGGLTSTVVLPAEDVPPAVREAAAAVVTAQAERVQLSQELADRQPARQQLLAQLSQQPDRKVAARQLSEFDAETELLAAVLPAADQKVQTAWENFAGAVHSSGAAWNERLHAGAPGDVQTALEAGEVYLRAVSRLRQRERLLAREQILQPVGEAPPAVFQRSQRGSTIDRIQQGASLGTEGEQYSLLGVVQEYQAALAKPQPPVEVDADVEVDPPAVAHRKRLLNPPPISATQFG